MTRRFLHGAMTVAVVAALGGVLSLPAQAAVVGIYAYPQAGQDQEQQSRDEFECSQWASRETGFDPMQTPPPASSGYAYQPPPPPPPTSGEPKGTFGIGSRSYSEGGLLQDAAIGGALGAVGGAIAGDAGEGALLGAGASLLFGGVQRLAEGEKQQAQQQQPAAQYQPPPPAYDTQAQQSYQRGLGEFRKAYGACMSSRQYTVR